MRSSSPLVLAGGGLPASRRSSASWSSIADSNGGSHCEACGEVCLARSGARGAHARTARSRGWPSGWSGMPGHARYHDGHSGGRGVRGTTGPTAQELRDNVRRTPAGRGRGLEPARADRRCSRIGGAVDRYGESRARDGRDSTDRAYTRRISKGVSIERCGGVCLDGVGTRLRTAFWRQTVASRLVISGPSSTSF